MVDELSPYEWQALEAAKLDFSLEESLVAEFAQSLVSLKNLFKKVALGEVTEFRAGRLVLIGFVNHTHHLLMGGLQALLAGNGPVWSACLRGLMETFGACVSLNENPQVAPNYLDQVKAGRLRAAAERGRPGLGGDIDRLSRIVHPGSGAIFAAFRRIDEVENYARITFGLQTPEVSDGQEAVRALRNVAALIVGKLKRLSDDLTLLSAGKLLIRRTAASSK